MNSVKHIRECPYCHRKVSIWLSSFYLFRGTDYSINCNHCHKKIKPKKEPVSFLYCVCAGFLSVVLPVDYCVYMRKEDFVHSVLFALPFFILVEIIILFLILKRIEYTKKFF